MFINYVCSTFCCWLVLPRCQALLFYWFYCIDLRLGPQFSPGCWAIATKLSQGPTIINDLFTLTRGQSVLIGFCMILLLKDCREEMVWICLNNALLSSTMVNSFYHRNGCGGQNMEGTMQEPMSFGPQATSPLASDLSDNGSQDLQKSLAMARPMCQR